MTVPPPRHLSSSIPWEPSKPRGWARPGMIPFVTAKPSTLRRLQPCDNTATLPRRSSPDHTRTARAAQALMRCNEPPFRVVPLQHISASVSGSVVEASRVCVSHGNRVEAHFMDKGELTDYPPHPPEPSVSLHRVLLVGVNAALSVCSAEVSVPVAAGAEGGRDPAIGLPTR